MNYGTERFEYRIEYNLDEISLNKFAENGWIVVSILIDTREEGTVTRYNYKWILGRRKLGSGYVTEKPRVRP